MKEEKIRKEKQKRESTGFMITERETKEENKGSKAES